MNRESTVVSSRVCGELARRSQPTRRMLRRSVGAGFRRLLHGVAVGVAFTWSRLVTRCWAIVTNAGRCGSSL